MSGNLAQLTTNLGQGESGAATPATLLKSNSFFKWMGDDITARTPRSSYVGAGYAKLTECGEAAESLLLA